MQDTPVTGRKADVLLAGYTAYQAALRLVKAGNKVSPAPCTKPQRTRCAG